jgi:lipopolysaccharide heptosyltransferase II
LKILLVRLRQIGDVVFTTPAVRAIRERFPDAHLAYIVEPSAAPVVDRHPLLTEVIIAPRIRGIRGVVADAALGWRLQRQAFDLAIDFHGGPRASLLTWLSRAPIRIGYRVAGRSWMYTRVVERPRALRARHSVENQWDLLASLHVAPPTAARYPVEMTPDAAADAAVVARLQMSGCQAGDSLIVMHVSAGNPFRRWPIPSFGEVAATLAARTPTTRVIVTSGPSEIEAAQHVVADACARLAQRDRPRVTAWADDFSLAQLRALCDRAALFIGGDSGPMHVAATSHVPIVSLYGPTLPARSAPWRDARWRSIAVEVSGLECRPCDQRVCAPGDFRCLSRIEPQEVVHAAGRLLP